ncbi:MAG: flagellar export chaperone FliS [Candidatus Brocadiia bacterium]
MTGTDPQRASRQYLAAEVEGADPLTRVAMLHEAAARFIRQAAAGIEEGEPARAHEAFLRAKRIIAHFLASIPEDDPSDLAADLRGLFTFAYRRLAEANLRKDPHAARQALQVVRTLGEGWAELTAHRGERPPQAPGAEPKTTTFLA